MKAPARFAFSRGLPYLLFWWVTLSITIAQATAAGTPSCWLVALTVPGGDVGAGVTPIAHDGWDGQAGYPAEFPPDFSGLAFALYREHTDTWGGPTGLYKGDLESPIPPGGSHTWWDFIVAAHNYTPNPPGQIGVKYAFDSYYSPPEGYVGHLVIDQVPDGVTWTGPMDYWFDMTVSSQRFLMPLAEEMNPLLGTRFHLTVYTPEPSSLAALLAALAGFRTVIRRRNR
jgi:hypothetical protein